MNRLRQGGSRYDSDRPVEFGLAPNDRERISAGPVDYDLIVTNQKERAGPADPGDAPH